MESVVATVFLVGVAAIAGTGLMAAMDMAPEASYGTLVGWDDIPRADAAGERTGVAVRILQVVGGPTAPATLHYGPATAELGPLEQSSVILLPCPGPDRTIVLEVGGYVVGQRNAPACHADEDATEDPDQREVSNDEDQLVCEPYDGNSVQVWCTMEAVTGGSR